MIIELLGSAILQVGIAFAKDKESTDGESATISTSSLQPLPSEAHKLSEYADASTEKRDLEGQIDTYKNTDNYNVFTSREKLLNYQNKILAQYSLIKNELSKDKFLSSSDVADLIAERLEKVNAKEISYSASYNEYDSDRKGWPIDEITTITHSKKITGKTFEKYTNGFGASIKKPTIYSTHIVSQISPVFLKNDNEYACVSSSGYLGTFYLPSSVDVARQLAPLKSIYIMKFVGPYSETNDTVSTYSSKFSVLAALSEFHVVNSKGAEYTLIKKIIYSEKTKESLVEIDYNGKITANCK